MKPVTWIDRDPRRKRWTCWHEAAHIFVALRLGGEVREVNLGLHESGGYELNMSVHWGANPEAIPAICAAGSVIDRTYGRCFTEDPEEIAHHSAQDKAELLKLCEERGESLSPLELDTLFEAGYRRAETILLARENKAGVELLRDALYNAYKSGKQILDKCEITQMATRLGLP